MKVKMFNCVTHNCGRDGIHVGEGIDLLAVNCQTNNSGRDGMHVSHQSASVEVHNSTFSNNGRDGFHYTPVTIEDVYKAGLKEETPKELIKKAEEIILKNKESSLEKLTSALKGIGFARWITKGSELSSITSLLMQLFIDN